VNLLERAKISGGPSISIANSGVSVWVVSRNEELMIALETLGLVRRLERENNVHVY
jgi:acetate kinase